MQNTIKNDEAGYPLIVFNTNTPGLFVSVNCRDGKTLTPEQVLKINDHCGPGPYLAFFFEYQFAVYRIRGPFNGWQHDLAEPWKAKFFIVDRASANLSDDLQETVNTILKSLGVGENDEHM